MDLIKLLNDLVANVSALQGQIAELQAKLIDAQAELDRVAKESYDKGFADGVASVPVSDKVFSQAEADALVASAVEPLKKEIEGLKLAVEAAKIEAEKSVKDGIAAMKAALKLKYLEMQVVESQLETGFQELLEEEKKEEEIPPIKEEEAPIEEIPAEEVKPVEEEKPKEVEM